MKNIAVLLIDGPFGYFVYNVFEVIEFGVDFDRAKNCTGDRRCDPQL